MKYERMVEIVDKINTIQKEIEALLPLTNGFWKTEFRINNSPHSVIITDGEGILTGQFPKVEQLVTDFAKKEIDRLKAEIQQLESLTEQLTLCLNYIPLWHTFCGINCI